MSRLSNQIVLKPARNATRPNELVSSLFDAIVTTLREMASESVNQGKPYALRGYPDYHRELYPGSFKISAWEEPITAGLAMRLCRKGVQATTEISYPDGSGRCDLVVQIDPINRFWIECKTAFRPCLRPASAGYGYKYDYEGDRTYEPSGKGSWVAGVADIALKDIPKLMRLQPRAAQFVGVLLLGFDRESRPLTNRELYALLPPNLDTWVAAHTVREGLCHSDCYPIRAKKGFRDRTWLWYQQVDPR
jgi:hypothetical protein